MSGTASIVRVDDQDGLHCNQKKRPLSIIQENDGDDADIGNNSGKRRESNDANSSLPPTLTTTTTGTQSIYKHDVQNSSKTKKNEAKKKPPNIDTSKIKTQTSDSKSKSPTSKIPILADSKIASKILQFSKNIRIVPKTGSPPPAVAPKPAYPFSVSSPSRIHNLSSPSKTTTTYIFPSPKPPTCSQTKSAFPKAETDISDTDTSEVTPSMDTIDTDPNEVIPSMENIDTDEDEMTRSMKNIVKRTVSFIESNAASNTQNSKTETVRRKISKEEKSTHPHFLSSSSDGEKRASDDVIAENVSESQNKHSQITTPDSSFITMTSLPSATDAAASYPTSGSPNAVSADIMISSSSIMISHSPSNGISHSPSNAISHTPSHVPPADSSSHAMSFSSSNSSPGLASTIFSDPSSIIPSNSSSIIPSDSSSNNILDPSYKDDASDSKSNQALSDGQGLAPIRESAESLYLKPVTPSISIPINPSSPRGARVPFSFRQNPNNIAQRSPKLGQKSPKLNHQSPKLNRSSPMSETISITINNNPKPVFFNGISPSNKGESTASDSENDENQTQNSTSDNSSSRSGRASSRSPFLAPKFPIRRGSYFFKRRISSSDSLVSMSENDSSDNVEEAPPISVWDFNKLKETTERLHLSTRRPSVLQWRQDYVDRPKNSHFLFKNGINGDNSDDKLTSERKQKIDEALEWLRNELQDMRSQDQMLARQLLSIRNDIHQLKLRRCTTEHQELLDDFKSELEELHEFSDVLDMPQPIYGDNPLKHIGVTRLNISARRFSAC